MCANSVITVSGLPGSGTSTVCELVAQATGFRYINAGAIFRELADEDGLSFAEFGRREDTGSPNSRGYYDGTLDEIRLQFPDVDADADLEALFMRATGADQ